MRLWAEIRQKVLVEGWSKREAMRQTGFHYETIEKVLTHSQPPGYRQIKERPKPKLGEHLEWIEGVLQGDKDVPRKQRHTAKRLWDRLKAERGYSGGYTAVKEMVRDLRSLKQEVFMPLEHRPGRGQFDFGEALARIGGKLMKAHFAVMSLPYSDGVFVQAFPRECTETFWEAHVRAFEFFDGVPLLVLYDNTKIAVTVGVGAGNERKLTEGFLQLRSHYLFVEKFCRVRRANEKGVVESMVKFVRQNFFVPVPSAETWEELNEMLALRCREDLKRKLRGKEATKEELLLQECLRPLPKTAFDACRKASTTASSLSLIRFNDNDYSVPVRWAHHPVVVKGYCNRVEIYHKQEKIAEHKREWERERVIMDSLHYLALLERKPGALDDARPLEHWKLPECFSTLRRALEEKKGDQGTKEYIGVLRLLEKHSLEKLRAAVEKTLAIRAAGLDVVEQFLWPQPDLGLIRFNLDGHPHLKGVRVDAPDLKAYRNLMTGGVR